SGVAYGKDTLVIVDSNRVQAVPVNNRVLVYRNISGKIPSATAALRFEGRCPVCGGIADNVLGQPDFTKVDVGLSQRGMRTPTGVATDGTYLAVADTDNNRVLIYNSIPTTNEAPADVVVGQPDFASNRVNFGGSGSFPSAKGLRGPQGVWIQDGRLYVADTQNHRVLIWNRIPTQNGQEADIVLGKPDFTTFVEIDLSKAVVEANASTLLNPVSVTSDGSRVFVADLGHNRVMVWNSIPSRNAQPADIALGQPDVTSTQDRNATAANNSPALCAPTGQKVNDRDVYPPRCAATMEFPRFALSDGKRLFVADGGNDRVLVYNTIPTASGQAADIILGQRNDKSLEDSSNSNDDRRSAADTLRTPMALAWDGGNLYVSDPWNHRVVVYTPGDQPLPVTSIRNAASQDIFAVGVLAFSAQPKENDEVTLKIGDKEYKYKAAKDQTVVDVINGLTQAVNAGAGDPLAFATPNIGASQIILTAKSPGAAGNDVTIAVSFSTGAQLAGALSGSALTGGQDAAKIAPGSLISILGQNLSDRSEASSPNEIELPKKLAGVEVYVDGLPAPLLFVSPTQINAQMPFEVSDAYSSSAYVRRERADGTVQITTAVAVPVIPENPGIFAYPGTDPRVAMAYHSSSNATGTILIDGVPKENDVTTVVIEDREYSYTVKKDDTLFTIRDALIALINEDPKVSASAAASVYTRITLTARVPGDEGEGIPYSIKRVGEPTVILTATNEKLCCANSGGAEITAENPAEPGETIIIYATGLGFVQPDEAKFAVITGGKYGGPSYNYTNAPIDAIAGGKTANVVFAGLKQGAIGIYEVRLQLNTDIPTNPQTQLTIAQNIYVSNIVTFPVVAPEPPPQ
ncbi:MAG TPA: hypothetical protein VEQ63_13855, partial [Bryobacteraceae bacterium]|nr:hypothetical protein [Bryobacteraceae bacterium]